MSTTPTDVHMEDETTTSPVTERPSKMAKTGVASSPSKSGSSSKEAIDLDDEPTTTTPTPATKSTTPSATTATSTGTSTAHAHHLSTSPRFTSSSFEYVDRDGISEFLICQRCTKPLYKPLEHRACTNVFCSSCLQTEKDSTTPLTHCPECHALLKQKEIGQPAKPLLLLLDSLQVRCLACSTTMSRSAYETHWLNACPQTCPFKSTGCTTSLPRSTMNAHIDSCSFAPVVCTASEIGCDWSGQRDALAAHSASCALSAALPVLKRLREEHLRAIALKDQEIAALNIALETRERQLRSHQQRPVAAASSTDTGVWGTGTFIDCLDTENSWLIAEIIKVDPVKRVYGIHYCDWDSSWDEFIPFNSQRLAPGGTHTSGEMVEKHVRKALALNAKPTTAASTTTASSTTAATTTTTGETNGQTTAGRTTGKGKRKSVN